MFENGQCSNIEGDEKVNKQREREAQVPKYITQVRLQNLLLGVSTSTVRLYAVMQRYF